jgi:hypothetical protein
MPGAIAIGGSMLTLGDRPESDGSRQKHQISIAA